jgi:hypothetical protein
MTLQDIKNYIIARIFPNTSQAITGATMQDTLLQMADSMNTPSGDPMHYAYVDAGAVWNANTGYWEMYDMKDITNEEMRKAYNFGNFNANDSAPLYASGTNAVAFIRFNLPRLGAYSLFMSSGSSFASSNARIEFINLCPFTTMATTCQLVNMTNAFYKCTSLRKIFGIIEMSYTTNATDTFKGCSSLVDVTIQNLKQNLSFAQSPLSVASAVYMLQNADATATFTITFRADRQAIFEADTDFVNAKNAKPNITILYQ